MCLVSVAEFEIFCCHVWTPHCGIRAPECMGLVVVASGSAAVARRLSHQAACRIPIHQPGNEPTSPVLEGWLLTTDHQEVPTTYCNWTSFPLFRHVDIKTLSFFPLRVLASPPENLVDRWQRQCNILITLHSPPGRLSFPSSLRGKLGPHDRVLANGCG